MDQLEVKFRITNYYEHPTDNRYVVFHYYKNEQAQTFEDLLLKNNIRFEKHIEDENAYIILFAIPKTHYKECVKYNFIAIGTHRKPFIPNRYLGYFLILLIAAAITLAIIGYLKSKSV
jgi:hypothetical protein